MSARGTASDRSGGVTIQWRRQAFVTGVGSEVWVNRGSRVRSPPVPVVLSVYQLGSLLDGLAMYLSRDTKKFHDNESTHILHNFWTSTHRGQASTPGGATVTIRYDTIRDAICTCAQKLTQVGLIYRTEPAAKKWGKRKSKKRICLEVSVNSPGNPWSQS